jgi:hypothetical protein
MLNAIALSILAKSIGKKFKNIVLQNVNKKNMLKLLHLSEN